MSKAREISEKNAPKERKMEILAVIVMLLICLLMISLLREPADRSAENHYDVWRIPVYSEKKAEESEKNR